MANQVVPTKGNLMATKKSLELARLGYDLLDKKRNVLIKEMMSLLDDVKEIRDDITDSYDRAYAALREANESLGIISDVVEGVLTPLIICSNCLYTCCPKYSAE